MAKTAKKASKKTAKKAGKKAGKKASKKASKKTHCKVVTIKPKKGKGYKRKLCWGKKGIVSNKKA